MVYTSTENEKIKDIKKLNQKKYRDKTGLFLVEGEHLVLEAYKSGCLKELLIEEDTMFPLDVETSFVSHNILSYISELDTPPSMIGVCRKKVTNDDIGSKVLALDAIQDPGNLGTIIRSAVAFHVDTIILGKGTVDVYNSKVVRASQGMLFHVNIIELDLENSLPKFKEDGYQIIGTKVTHGKSLKDIEKVEKFVIIMGNEGNGMSEPVAELCDSFIYIDMSDVCESLNVGVATSIILYELDK
jgi:TrmH family RNA methyltransferase